MSTTAAAAARTTPSSNWDNDRLSETFSDVFSDAFQVPLRQVSKNVLGRMSEVNSGGGGGATKVNDDQRLHMKSFHNRTKNGDKKCVDKIEPSIAVVEQVNSLAMSYSSGSDTTNGREARDDSAEQGTVSSEDTSTASPTAVTSVSKTKEDVKVETVQDFTTAVTTKGMGGLSHRKKVHQKYKLKVTESRAKKKEEPENNPASAQHGVKVSRRNKALQRLAKSRESFASRRHVVVGGGNVEQVPISVEQASITSDGFETIFLPPPPPPPRHFNVAIEDEITLDDMVMVLEANVEAAKIENSSLQQQLDGLNRELTISNAENQCLADKMEDLIDKLTTVKAEKATLQCTANDVNNTNQKLVETAAELKQRTKILDEKVAMLDSEKKSMESQLKKKKALVIQLKDAAQSVENELQWKNCKMEELVEAGVNLREEIYSLKESVTTLQEDVTSKETAIEDATSLSNSLKEEVSRSNTELVKVTKEAEELRELKADAEARIDLLRSTMKDYSHQVIDLEARLGESQAATACLEDEKNTLKGLNDDLAERLATASAGNKQKDVTIEDLKSQADSAMKAATARNEDLESQVAMLQRQLRESKIQSSKFELENHDLKNRLHAAERNEERLTQENTESNDLVADLQSRVLDMTVENSEITTTMEELQSKVDTVTKERDLAQSTVVELTSGNEKTYEILQTLQSEKNELLTKLDKAENALKACESEKCAYLNASTLANREREVETAKYSTKIATMSVKTSELEGKVESLTTDLNLSKSEVEDTKSKLESELSKSKMLELEYRTTVGMLGITKGDKDKISADLLDNLNGVIASSKDKDRESTAQLTALTTEKDELANKVLTMNAELNKMHSLVETLKAEKNSALAKVNDLVVANATLFESMVKEVSCRLDSEFAQSQEQMDKLNAEIAELQGANWGLTKENDQLHSNKEIAEAHAAKLEETQDLLEVSNSESREASLKETSAALEEIKATKRVTWSSFASVSRIDSHALNEELASPPITPASSCTSGSGFVDASIAEQVNKALDWARSRRNLPKG